MIGLEPEERAPDATPRSPSEPGAPRSRSRKHRDESPEDTWDDAEIEDWLFL